MIEKRDVEYVSQLAHLDITEQEKEKFTKDLGSIINFVEKLNELDTEKVSPLAHIIPIKNVMRDDEIKESLSNDEVLKNAPAKERGHYKVPKIIE